MTDKQSERVYRIIDVVGVSETSWEDAGRIAVETAAGSLRDLRVAEVTKMDMKVDNGKMDRLPYPSGSFVQIQFRGILADKVNLGPLALWIPASAGTTRSWFGGLEPAVAQWAQAGASGESENSSGRAGLTWSTMIDHRRKKIGRFLRRPTRVSAQPVSPRS